MRVLELSERDEAAAYCGKLYARWGAEVIRVEPPDRPVPRESLELYLHGGKRRVTLDYRDPAQRAMLDRLAASCDVLVTDATAREVDDLGLLDLGGDAGPAVRTSVTPFGLSGPYRDWEATGSTLLALGGYTWLHGDAGRAPLTMPGNYPHYQAGSYAYIASLAAQLRTRGEDGAPPVRVEVSTMEALASLHQFTFTMLTNAGLIRSRHGNRWENLAPTGLMPCKDGWWGCNILPNFWRPFTLMIGKPELADDPRFINNNDRMEHIDELEQIIHDVFKDWSKQRIFTEGQETWRVPVGYAVSLQDTLDDPHLNAREFWRPIEGMSEGGEGLRTSGSPFFYVDQERPTEHAPVAPGTDTADVLGALPEATSDGAPAASLPAPARPLDGVRILDLTRIWSGPLSTLILGDMGADVVKIEAQLGRGPAVLPPGIGNILGSDAPEKHWNRQGLFNKLNRNKRSVAIDLKSEQGRAIFLRLVAEADVVIENFSARAMPGLGLGYEEMKQANEQIIYVAMQAFGQQGPYRDYIGLGPSIEPLIGLTAIMGYSDDEPRVTSKALTDAMGGVAAAAAVVTALDRRERTGEGGLIDLSQHETGVVMVGEQLIERQQSGVEPSRIGNADRAVAPHGVYRCAGDAGWITIAATDDRQWQGLAIAAGAGWADDTRFTTNDARLEHREALDQAIEAWTVGFEKVALMNDLQAAGVPAGAVYSSPEVMADPHLAERGYWIDLDEPDNGLQRYDGSPVHFDGDRGYAQYVPAPTLGGDNEAVLGGLLGMSDRDVAALYEGGVIVDRPPG
jgi:crotonobetainyl-CoA:carnitine CoA-transferase CaiB-like acyl-CoA transferase